MQTMSSCAWGERQSPVILLGRWRSAIRHVHTQPHWLSVYLKKRNCFTDRYRRKLKFSEFFCVSSVLLVREWTTSEPQTARSGLCSDRLTLSFLCSLCEVSAWEDRFKQRRRELVTHVDEQLRPSSEGAGWRWAEGPLGGKKTWFTGEEGFIEQDW